MKKLLCIILCGALALCLAACGAGESPEPSPEPDPAEGMVELAPVTPTPEPVSGTDALPGIDEPPASASDAAPALDEAAFAAAQACVGRAAAELTEAVGEPDSAGYAASCLEENAEDGMLLYEALGFYVWTVRGESGETVHAVYPLE